MKRTEKIQSFGFFNVDKPSGITSGAVVNKCKWLTGVPCGHMGTLDPLASGVLPVGIGNATRLFDYFLQKEKIYVAEFTFGVTSDTLDSTGELVYGGDIPTPENVQSVLPDLVGDIMQMPPKYSAKNVNGKRGYELARAGVEFELAPKQVRIESIDCLGKADNANAYLFRIKCGGGTYIRSIARDMASLLGTQAVMSSLRREQSGIFTLKNSIPYSLLEQDLPVSELEKYVIKTDSVLPYPTLTLTEKQERSFYNGAPTRVDEQDGLYKIYNKDGFYGIAQVLGGNVKIKTKLC